MIARLGLAPDLRGKAPANRPYTLAGQGAAELAKLPTDDVMDLAEEMPATVAKAMPSPAAIAA